MSSFIFIQPRDRIEEENLRYFKLVNQQAQSLCLEFLNTAKEFFERSQDGHEDDTACQRWLSLLKGVVFNVDQGWFSALTYKLFHVVSLVATVRTCVRAGGHLSSEEFTSIMSSLNTVSDCKEFKTKKLKEDMEDLKDMLGAIMEGSSDDPLETFLDELFDATCEAVFSKLWPQIFSFESIVIKPAITSTSPVPPSSTSLVESNKPTPTVVLVTAYNSEEGRDGNGVNGRTKKPKTEEIETLDGTVRSRRHRRRTSPLPSRDTRTSDKSADLQPPTKRKSRSTTSGLPRKKNTRWTPTEEQLLWEGVKTFGAGKWTKILKMYPFDPCRNSMSLKDKWRIITRNIARADK